MSVNLVGYHAIGPANLNEKKKKRAIARLHAKQAMLRSVVEKLMSPGVSGADLERAESAIYKYLSDLWPDCDLDAFEYRHEAADYILGLDATQVVEDLFCCWHSGYRDTSWRVFGKNNQHRTVFCGDMSWGDSPDGLGYTALHNAAALGLWEEFGIE